MFTCKSSTRVLGVDVCCPDIGLFFDGLWIGTTSVPSLTGLRMGCKIVFVLGHRELGWWVRPEANNTELKLLAVSFPKFKTCADQTRV